MAMRTVHSRFGAVALAAALAACVHSDAVQCPSGITCPRGFACDDIHQLCVQAHQLTSCNGLDESTPCDVSASGDGYCRDGVCLLPTCGNNILEGAEDCDGLQLGTTADGRPIDCGVFGYHDAQPLACRSDCLHDIATCSGPRCGDGIITAPMEYCDGGPPSETCVDFGYDLGHIGCNLACVPDFSECALMGWQLRAIGPPGIIASMWGTATDNLYAVAGTDVIHFTGGSDWVPIPQLAGSPREVWGRSADDIYVIASPAKIWHWNGVAWTEVTANATGDVRALWTAAGSSVFIGGTGGIFRYDGTSWIAEHTGGGVVFEAIHGTSDANVFAVGTQGAIYRRNPANGTWSAMPSNLPTTTTLRGVWALGPSNVYAVGGDDNGTANGTVVHYNGQDWSPQPLPLDANGIVKPLRSVWGDAQGVFAQSTQDIYYFDGARWLRMENPITTTLGTVFGLSSTDVYIGSGQRILRYRGTPFWSPQIMPSSTSTIDWLDVRAVSPDLVFVVGSDTATNEGKLFVTNGHDWTDITPNTTDTRFTSVWGTAMNNIYVGGSNPTGQATLRTYNGSWSLEYEQTNGAIVSGIWGLPGGPILATVASSILRRDGPSSWPVEKPSGGVRLNDISGTASATYASGGSFVMRRTGTTWSQETIQNGPQTSYGIWVGAADNVFAVGTGGKVAHWNGSAWDVEVVGGFDTWWDVDGTDATHVFAAGDNGKLWRYDGSRWMQYRSRTTKTLRAVGVLADRVFVIGDDGTLDLLVNP